MQENNFHELCDIPRPAHLGRWWSFPYGVTSLGWLVAPALHWGGKNTDETWRAWDEQCRVLGFDLSKYNDADPLKHNPRVISKMMEHTGVRYLFCDPDLEPVLRPLARRIYIADRCQWEQPYLDAMTDYWEEIPEAQRLRWYAAWGVEPSDEHGLEILPSGEAINLLTVWNWLLANNAKFAEKVEK